VKVPGAVKLMYRSTTSERQQTQPVSTRVNDNIASSHTVIALDAGTGSMLDTLQKDTEVANPTGVDAGTVPTSDANSVQQNQRQVCPMSATDICPSVLVSVGETGVSDDDRHKNFVFPNCSLRTDSIVLLCSIQGSDTRVCTPKKTRVCTPKKHIFLGTPT